MMADQPTPIEQAPNPRRVIHPESYRIGSHGLNLIRRFEGFRAEAYWDALGGIWTVGYGHTRDAYQGQTLTKEAAEEQLRLDILELVLPAIRGAIKRPIRQYQGDALASFVFNLGASAFRASTLLRKLNQSEDAYVPGEMTRWVHAGGDPVDGLARRRAAEASLFMGNLEAGEDMP